MRSKLLAALALCVLTTLSACGKFGNKDDNRTLFDYAPESIGCLNDIGARVQSFLNGTISAADWGATIDCATSSLTQFQQFVQGSAPDGSYTQADIAAFLANFLLTSYPNNSKLVASGFDLKAALIGGTNKTATPTDVNTLIRILGTIKAETTKLIPLLQKRANNPSRQNLLDLSDAIVLAGATIAASLGPGTQSIFTWDSLNTLAQELANVANKPLPDRFINWVSAGKLLIFSGDQGGMSGEEIPQILQLASAYLGPLIGVLAVPQARLGGSNPTWDAYLALAEKARPAIEQTLNLHGGALPLTNVDQLLEAFPTSWISLDIPTLEATLRPFVEIFLRSETANGFDGSALQMVYATSEDWVESQKLVDEIYGTQTSMAPSDFIGAANALGATDPATTQRVGRLTFLAQFFMPLLEQGDYQVNFVPQTQLTQTDVSQMLWIRIAVEQIMQSYSSIASRDRVTLDDFHRFIDDYQNFGFTLHLIDPSIPNAYENRFREADIFTPSSNGDGSMDMNEATYYIAYFYSGKVLSMKLLGDLAQNCARQGQDPLLYNWVTAACFRQRFYGNYRQWWDHFPDLITFYQSLSAADQQNFQVALENGSRRCGYSENLFASFDSDAVTGLIHFMETMFVRFDRNHDGILDLNELMIAYPVFKNALAKIANVNPSDDNTLQAVYTYILKYKKPPTTDIIGLAELLIWELEKPTWSLSDDRMAIYTVMAQLAEQGGSTCASQ